MSVIYKTQLVPITKHDVEKFAELSEEEKALIGQVYIDKAMFNAECTRRLKDAKKKLDEYATFIKSEEHEVPCRVEIDLHENKARIYREDTGDYVRSRPVEDDERQATMFAPPVPVRNTASEAAKAKSPGLKVQETLDKAKFAAGELLKNFGPELAAEVAERVKTDGPSKALAWGIEEKVRRDAAAKDANNAAIDAAVANNTAPDEVRAALLAADVPTDMVDAAVGAIRDGAKPEVVIANAKRGSKPEKAEKPAKEKKTKAKKDAPTAEEQARLDLRKELQAMLGNDIGTDAAFAIIDGRMERAEAIAKGEELKALFAEDDELDDHATDILEDVFTEHLTVDEAVHNARLQIDKIAEARTSA